MICLLSEHLLDKEWELNVFALCLPQVGVGLAGGTATTVQFQPWLQPNPTAGATASVDGTVSPWLPVLASMIDG